MTQPTIVKLMREIVELMIGVEIEKDDRSKLSWKKILAINLNYEIFTLSCMVFESKRKR